MHHPDYLKHFEPEQKPKAVSSNNGTGEEWQSELRLEIVRQAAAKWRKWTIITASVSVLIIVTQAVWYYTHPKYVGIPIRSEEPYFEETELNARIEEKFLQMTNVLRYLVDEVKKHDEALAIKVKNSSEQSKYDPPRVEVALQAIEKAPSFIRAVVTTDKANVRPVPNLSSKPIMTLDRGTELLVDLRQEEWNRVVTPTGQKAWMSAKVMELEGAG